MHIHLDLIGGIAGDMFLASILNCFPEYLPEMQQVLSDAGFNELVTLEVKEVNDGVISGSQVDVNPGKDAEGHHHRHFSEIRTLIENAAIDGETKRISINIFTLLAEAEGRIHGKDPEKVAFHEVGAWDSIADILCSAFLIGKLNATWSVSALPIGKGQVDTAHGRLPIPAPATSLLLEGFQCFDDGLEGERITPTGAAILKHLAPAQDTSAAMGSISRSGYGLGKKKFPGISNVLRCLVFDLNVDDLNIDEAPADITSWHVEQILQLEFEVDDQTPEELALALDHIRDTRGVLDAIQWVASGKKGRQVFCIRILARPAIQNQLLRLCFQETTTLGIRHQKINRSILPRQDSTVTRGNAQYNVKLAQRLDQVTVKAEMDDLAKVEGTYSERQEIRRKIETEAIRKHRDSNDESNPH